MQFQSHKESSLLASSQLLFKSWASCNDTQLDTQIALLPILTCTCVNFWEALDCGRKPEYLEESHNGPGLTCKSPTARPAKDLKQEPSCSEATVLHRCATHRTFDLTDGLIDLTDSLLHSCHLCLGLLISSWWDCNQQTPWLSQWFCFLSPCLAYRLST